MLTPKPRLTSAGDLNLTLCEAYSAPGNAEPMMAGKSETRRMPGTRVPPNPGTGGEMAELSASSNCVATPR